MPLDKPGGGITQRNLTHQPAAMPSLCARCVEKQATRPYDQGGKLRLCTLCWDILRPKTEKCMDADKQMEAACLGLFVCEEPTLCGNPCNATFGSEKDRAGLPCTPPAAHCCCSRSQMLTLRCCGFSKN